MSNSQPVILSVRHGRLECDVPAVGGWDGFDKLFRFLELNYGAATTERIDGPDARRWIFRIRNLTLELHHEDPWGNVVVSPKPESDDLLREIADDLSHRLQST